MSRLCLLQHVRTFTMRYMTLVGCMGRGGFSRSLAVSCAHGQERGGFDKKWNPIVLKYMQNANAVDYPSFAALVATVCHAFHEFSLAYIAELLCEASENSVDCTPVMKLLIDRLAAEKHTCAAADLASVAKLCALRTGMHHTVQLADLVFYTVLERKRHSLIEPAEFAAIFWCLRDHIRRYRAKLVPREQHLKDPILSKLSLPEALQVIAVCHHSVFARTVKEKDVEVRQAWHTGALGARERNTVVLAMLAYVEAAEEHTAAVLRGTLQYCVHNMQLPELDINIAVAIVTRGRVHLVTSTANAFTKRFVQHCVVNIGQVDGDLVRPLLSILCSTGVRGNLKEHRSSITRLLAQAVSEVRSCSSGWLSGLCNAVLENMLFHSWLVRSIVAIALHNIKDWTDPAEPVWASLANLLLFSCNMDEQLVAAVLCNLTMCKGAKLVSAGGVIYWLWAASACSIDIPPDLLAVLDVNPMHPMLRKDHTLYLLQELQWIHRRRCISLNSRLDQNHLGISKMQAEKIVSVFGHHVYPVCCQLLNSRPVWCSAFLLNAQRQMQGWNGVSVQAVTPDWLTKNSAHAVAVILELGTLPTSSLQQAHIDLHVWKATVEARGWHVVTLKTHDMLHISSDVQLRHLIAKESNIR
eukprot:scpid13252/ scgid19573/ 